ncbi:DUF6386 family protein [Pseudoduganella sp. UC29_71]|jgi:hypothetical protein|uniref:DUF6386 family protein n=1 Tax=Pseudoduganella sp. UC29_71 TaxID=3350174 RepID=UPI00366F6B01
MNISEYKFATDTATMCIFDLASLKDRLADDADWWCTPQDELNQVNMGNCIFLGLGSDGNYGIHLVDKIDSPQVTINLNIPSGHVFLGAAEEVTADGLEPEALRGGGFLDLKPGTYTLNALKVDSIIRLSLSLNSGEVRNSFDTPIRL